MSDSLQYWVIEAVLDSCKWPDPNVTKLKLLQLYMDRQDLIYILEADVKLLLSEMWWEYTDEGPFQSAREKY